MADRRQPVQCPALFFCAPASGQGKTTVTAAIARYHSQRGKRVRVFKTGPDYLDPLILEQACGYPVAQLDLWMVGETECRRQLFEAAASADLILVEGVMGMFDGNPSGADMAETFDIPVAIVINARAMAQTFGAIALGLATHRSSLKIAGVIANALGSQRHRDLITESVPESIKLLGTLSNHAGMGLPERHLGLVQPQEVDDIDERLDHLASLIEGTQLAELPAPVTFNDGVSQEVTAKLDGVTVGIARDEAFTFIYAANVRLLESMGATCVYFSPMHDKQLPDVDALWFPGGYPELHMPALTSNVTLHEDIARFSASGKKILAECGGMLYLMNSITSVKGQRSSMVGLLPGDGIMRERGGCQGMQYAVLPEGEFRAHAHHRTRCENTLEPIAYGRRPHHPAPGEPIYQSAGITASYLHLYFPSNPGAVSALFAKT